MKDKTDKEIWNDLSSNHEDIPVFLQNWWWDIVCGASGWGVVLSKSPNNSVLGAILYEMKTSYGIKRLTLPLFTPTNGLWLSKHDTQKKHSIYSRRRKIILHLIDAFPKASFIDLKLYDSIDDCLPFKWKGFKQTTVYTQIIDLTAEEEELFANMKSSTRAKINQASKIVEIKEIKNIETFLPEIESIFDFKHLRATKKDFNKIIRLDRELQRRNSRTIYGAFDEDGNIQASIYIIYTAQTAHYWLGGANPLYRANNSMYYLLWEVIKESKKRVETFDFHGSNHQRISPVFLGLGGIPLGQQRIYKSSNRFTKLLRMMMKKDG